MARYIQTKHKFKDYIKAIKKCCEQKKISVEIYNGKGTARRFELFKDSESCPFAFWVAHESKKVYSGDFKKAYEKLGITKEKFVEILDII